MNDKQKKSDDDPNFKNPDFWEIDTLNDFDPQDEIEEKKEKSHLSKKMRVESLNSTLFFILIFYVFSLIYWNTEYKNLLWVNQVSVFEKKEYWRLLSSIFVHAHFYHFLANLPLFIIFSLLLRNYYGILAFPVVSLFLGVCTNAITIFFYKKTSKLVGASGMIYAMAALWLIWYVRYEKNQKTGKKVLRICGFIFVILLPSTYSPRTSYLAHSVGFILGILVAIFLIPTLDEKVREKKGIFSIDT